MRQQLLIDLEYVSNPCPFAWLHATFVQLCRHSAGSIDSKLRTAGLTLSMVYMGTGDQPMVFSTALEVQREAGKRVVQLEEDVKIPQNSPYSLSKVFVDLMTFLNGDGRAEEVDRLPRTGEFSGNCCTDI